MFELLGAAAGEAEQLERLQRIFPALQPAELIDRAGRLYIEYFMAFKSKPRLHWGELKRLLDVDHELQLMEESTAEAEAENFDIVLIDRHEWVRVTGGYQGEDLRAELLEVCSYGNPYELQRWLKDRDITGIIPDRAFEWFDQLGGRSWQHPDADGWQPVAGGRLNLI